MRLSSLACAALWWMQVNTPLNVEAVRVALHSLPEGWKRWYPTLMVDGPNDTLMDLFKKALAGPDFVPLAQDFLAAFRAHSEGGETVTNNCYQLLCRVNHVKHRLASHDRLQQLFLRGSVFLPIAILIAAGIVHPHSPHSALHPSHSSEENSRICSLYHRRVRCGGRTSYASIVRCCAECLCAGRSCTFLRWWRVLTATTNL